MEFVLKLDNPLFYEEVAEMHKVVFAKLQTLEEMAYSWMDDVLEDAKKAFSNQSNLCILPKTPAAKQKGRRKKAKQNSAIARQLITSDCADDDYVPPKHLETKPARPSRKRHVVDVIDDDFEDSSNKVSKLETSPVRRTRAASRAATTSHAKNTRANKGKEKNKSRSQEPIKNLEKLIIDECEQAKEKDKSVCEVTEWIQPVSCSVLAPEFAMKVGTSQCKTPIQNFNSMNVKEKAHAYEEIMLISDTPVTKSAKKSMSKIDDIQTPVKQSLSPHTPTNEPIPQTTPDTTVRLSDICLPAIKLPVDSDIENTPISSHTDDKSSKDSRKSVRKSLKVLPSAAKFAAINKEPEIKPARTRTRLRLKKKDKSENVGDNEETVISDDCNQSESTKEASTPQNKRRTRSVGRDSGFAKDHQDKNEEVNENMDTEDDLENVKDSENFPTTAKPTGTKNTKSAVERVKNDDKDSGVDDSGSSMDTDGPLRVTRSKVRKPKTPDAGDNNVLASPTVPRATRTKTRKRQHEEESDNERRQPKRSCTISVLSADENNTPKQESPDVGSDEDMGSPKYPANKAGRPVPSFLNSLNKNSKNPIVQSHPGNTDQVKSFIVRNSPAPKLNMRELQEKRRQELLEKQRKEQERLKKRDEENKKRMEEMRKKREEKAKKVQELKEHREQEERMNRIRIEKRLAEKRLLTQKLRDEKIKEDKEKQKLRLQKMEEAEERRKQEEEERRKKLHEQQEQEKFHEAMLQRKKEFEEQERLQKIEDEKRRAVERQQEIERERDKERDRLKKVEEEKHREWQKKKEEKEKQIAAERAERERMEFEKKRERELQLKKEMERIKEQERLRLAEQERLRNEERKRIEEIKKMVDKHNSQLNHSKPLPKPEFNKTRSLEEPTVAHSVNNDSYEMTPKRVPQASTAENYGIDDLNSGDETDDDECPRKKIPDWAQGSQLKTLLIRQHYNPPNLDAMFDVIEPPDLNVLFEKKKARFNKRTSSAHWDTPILKPGMLGRV